MSPDYLEIYLDDHRAALAALVRLSRRVLRNNRSSPWASELSDLHEAIKQDAAILDGVAETLDLNGGSLKRVAALVAERAARLKLNGHILTYSPLSRLLELEGLMAALEFKRNMWAGLDRLLAGRGASGGFDPVTMKERSESQQEMARPVLQWAAEELAGA